MITSIGSDGEPAKIAAVYQRCWAHFVARNNAGFSDGRHRQTHNECRVPQYDAQAAQDVSAELTGHRQNHLNGPRLTSNFAS
jgi:hypothetical protein